MKMIQGGRALAAALAGAQAFVQGANGEWKKGSVKRWRRFYDWGLTAHAARYGVRADDARRVLG